MSLEVWLRNGWLRQIEPTVPQVQRLLQVVDREISDSGVKGLSPDNRFMHAYNAALQLCALALCVAGYDVAKGQGKHKHTIGALKWVLGKKWSDSSDYLEQCSRQRGQAFYEQIDIFSEKDANDLLAEAKKLREDVLTWLRANHEDLLPAGY